MQEPNGQSTKLVGQLCFPLYACSREVIKRYRPYLDAVGLTYTQYVAMLVFWEEGSVSVKELGRRLYLDSGTLTPVLKSLEQKGYITRRRSETDERVLIAALTDAGAALRENAAEIPGRICACIQLEPEDAMQLHQLLYKLLDVMK
ncbi:MAG: MarR family transcriptional regulator [Oscillospiraceae bacterium]|nr:MarR family transcriptional regulator [Oscillospiraceae bacterium]